MVFSIFFSIKNKFFYSTEVPDKLSKLLKVLMKHHTQVEAHYILVLILRLRQMCCHPSLIKSMLDKEDIDFEGEGLPIQKMNSDMLQKLDDLMTDEEDSDDEEFNINESMAKRVMSRTNPVFKTEKLSSKVYFCKISFYFIFENFTRVYKTIITVSLILFSPPFKYILSFRLHIDILSEIIK